MATDHTSPAADNGERLSVLADRVANCRQCPRLVEWREQVARDKRAAFADQDYWGRGVPGFGDPEAELMIVGLAPAAHGANRTGRMFTGDRSGHWLYGALFRAGFANQPESTAIDDGLVLRNAFVTSPVKCAPPANKPTTAERDTCRPFLDIEFETLRPTVFIALGGFAFAALNRYLDLRPRPTFGHGVEVDAGDGRTVLGCFHVSQQNTFTGRLTVEMIDAVFGRARELLDQHASASSGS